MNKNKPSLKAHAKIITIKIAFDIFNPLNKMATNKRIIKLNAYERSVSLSVLNKYAGIKNTICNPIEINK